MDRNDKMKEYLRRGSKILRLVGRVCSRFLLLQEVKDRYSAVVKMIDSGDKLKLDQTHLETVIPAPGGPLSPAPGPHLGLVNAG